MTCDILIRNGLIVDGTGRNAPYPADVALSGDRIAALENLGDVQAGRTIDATGHAVAPGFIDVHVHGEVALLTGRDRHAEVRQGVTTLLTAPDGFGWTGLDARRTEELWTYTRFGAGQVDIPLGWETPEDYLGMFPGHSPANVFPQVPHCAVRLAEIGWDPRPATDEEIRRMGNRVREWMVAGAGALNLGLDYQPSANADTRELIALCRIAAEYGGIYAAHIRYHTIGRADAWQETFDLSKAAGIPVHISHERVDEDGAGLLDRADLEDVDLTFKSNLYPAGMSHMFIMLPVALQSGSPDEVMARLVDPAVRAEALPELSRCLGQGNQVVGYTGSGDYVGETLADLAARDGRSVADFAYDLLLREGEHQAFVFPWQVEPETAEAILTRTATHPRMMVASDGIYNIPHPHPRGFGCFARVLRLFVREGGRLTLEQAIHKMSGFPASRFGIPDRGELDVGKAADLVLFDPASVADGATFSDPIRPPVGIPWVLVNGVPVIEGGEPTADLPGRVLRRRH